MALLRRVGFLALAIIFHTIYTYSIFDIYFVSPIVSGMREFGVQRAPSAKAPAKRLFLFVGDGLRADKAFQYFPDPSPGGVLDPDYGNPEKQESSASSDSNPPRPLAPFIRSRVLHHGTFGVSHTRVPTESRPGHVALIAGLYEDVSSVTTGWKLNPVNFDSVFNRSRHTWSWGSPDILPMFKEGATPGKIDAESYSDEAEYFSKDGSQLDIWVFEKVKALFAAAKEDPELNARLREDKLIFFLHLLGLDTAGHFYRPYSKEYLHNIKVVDQGVKEITELAEEFYGDNESAFVFTADHGMSDWGSHGDGHPDNTRTPLVVWGSGVAKPKIQKRRKAPGHEDGFSSDWNLDNVHRHDVAQADVAALMAYLVGLDFPVNSVGELPLAYLDATPKEKALAALANTQGVLEMYRVKEEKKRASTLRYQPYRAFGDDDHSIEKRISEIERLISRKKYDEAIRESSNLLHTALEGLRYLQTYDWLFLRTIVTAGYLGWIAYALTTVVDLHVLHGSSVPSRTTFSTMFFSSILVILYSIFWIQKSSWRYYAYGIFPIFFWEEVVAKRNALAAGRKILLSHVQSPGGYISFGLQILVYVGVLEALVQSYFHREIYTICFILAAIWPISYGIGFLLRNRLVVATWSIGCALMSIFTLLPANKVEDVTTITLGGTLMVLVGLLYLIFEASITPHSKTLSIAVSKGSRRIMGMQTGMILLAIIVTRSTITSLQSKEGLPLGNQVVGWSILVVSLVLPFFHRLYPNSHYLHRLVAIFLAFSPTFIILTISYEGLFYFVFCITLLSWVQLEHRIYTYTSSTPSVTVASSDDEPQITAQKSSPQANSENQKSKSPYRILTTSDARIALFFFFLLQSAFFSTGNIASISSFSLECVSRLIPVFNPFSQAALLILKILIPFAIISAILGILNRRLGVAPSALFMVVMSISDIMTLNFFYMVRDEGSWLDIGTTISHFCIASGLCTFVAGLEFLSEGLISGVKFEDADADAGTGDGASAGIDGNGNSKPEKDVKETQTTTKKTKKGKAAVAPNGANGISSHGSGVMSLADATNGHTNGSAKPFVESSGKN
ncbi:phosphatidylinositol glycan, class N [Blastomyces parvus]|uniref:GPI ethanolamine phosphate transferase 1 n=1 Tax=Blastomyces parvus TaxID=2060905 RepID=A0A2B7WM31_9EURO|nr:phosphatidylinositol glycan, class N [Blastomyces parvus]